MSIRTKTSERRSLPATGAQPSGGLQAAASPDGTERLFTTPGCVGRFCSLKVALLSEVGAIYIHNSAARSNARENCFAEGAKILDYGATSSAAPEGEPSTISGSRPFLSWARRIISGGCT